MQPKRWEVAPRAPAAHFAKFPDLPPLIVQILYNRGFTDIAEINNFIACRWAEDDPFTLKGMAEAVERLRRAIKKQEPIAVYGDYDADGVTATALMMQVLTALGAKVQPYIPNRFDEGYGLNNEALAELAAQGVKVVLTVDCGIRSVPEVAYGRSLGLDIIITDHHTVGEAIPPALAAINPKQGDCPYPFEELAGVGLAYKLAQALAQTGLLHNGHQQPADFLDLVAVGTVADLAPLYGENRKLVSQGLQQLNQSLRPGLQALMAQVGPKSNTISTGTIGFVIGPRLNAAGRLDSALAAYHLLMAQHTTEASQLAAQLDAQNRERQELTLNTVEIARQIILADDAQQPLYFISQPDFNPGVVGLAASRLTEEFYRPTLIAERGPETTKGSARSIREFHITEALDQCADLLVRYGGHAAAAGFTLKNENVPEFQERLRHIARQNLDVAQLRPTITIDGEVNLRGVRPPLAEAIATLQPFGCGNPTPCFLTRNLEVKYFKTVGLDDKHLRLILHDGRHAWSAIAFRQGYWAGKLRTSQQIDVVYHLEFNEWNGERLMQLNVQDLHPSETSRETEGEKHIPH
ncbi:MAG: single-stranded-DNA-specific exonuclease RecJ [Anaerolineae bacterium]|nr:single-stranded-DNA-specific exonuclease RecJ [Anaerolineae bacterium]